MKATLVWNPCEAFHQTIIIEHLGFRLQTCCVPSVKQFKRPAQDAGCTVREGGGSKNDRDKTFRVKEKRKRDNGQNGDRNWVEEEKRLLKHSGAGGFGFD